MKTYNIQYREHCNGILELNIEQVRANNLEEAKQIVISKNGLRDSQVLRDEAIL